MLATVAGGIAAKQSVKWVGNKFGGGGGAPAPGADLPSENTDAAAQQSANYRRIRWARARAANNTNLTQGLASPASLSQVLYGQKQLLGS